MKLTPREITALLLLREGLSNGEIAHRMGVATSTVGNLLAGCFRKLGVSETPDPRGRAIARLWRERCW